MKEPVSPKREPSPTRSDGRALLGSLANAPALDPSVLLRRVPLSRDEMTF
jgi:hypothetical protein